VETVASLTILNSLCDPSFSLKETEGIVKLPFVLKDDTQMRHVS